MTEAESQKLDRILELIEDNARQIAALTAWAGLSPAGEASGEAFLEPLEQSPGFLRTWIMTDAGMARAEQAILDEQRARGIGG